MTVSLTDTKQHLRVLHDDDDLLIQSYLDAALAEVPRYICADLPDPLPADLVYAVMDMVTVMYDHRADPEAKPGLPPAAARIAARYRRVAL